MHQALDLSRWTTEPDRLHRLARFVQGHHISPQSLDLEPGTIVAQFAVFPDQDADVSFVRILDPDCEAVRTERAKPDPSIKGVEELLQYGQVLTEDSSDPYIAELRPWDVHVILSDRQAAVVEAAGYPSNPAIFIEILCQDAARALVESDPRPAIDKQYRELMGRLETRAVPPSMAPGHVATVEGLAAFVAEEAPELLNRQ